MNAHIPIKLEIKEFSRNFASVAFSNEKKNSPVVMWGRLKDGFVSRLSIKALAYSKEGSHFASALLYANSARMEIDAVKKGKLFALAAGEATLSCHLKATLKYDSLAMSYFRKEKYFNLAEEHRKESGKRYRLSASDTNTSWNTEERQTLLEIAKYREPDNQTRVIIGSGVPSSHRYYDQFGLG